MNAEISKIRKLRNMDEIIDSEPERINPNKMTEIIHRLNHNMGELYHKQYHGNITINDFVNKFIENIYIVLNLFIEMGIYPDYFYKEIVKMNIAYKKQVKDNTVRGRYHIFRSTNLSVETIEAIKAGLKNQDCYSNPSDSDINDAYLEMIKFFRAFNIPHGITTEEHIINSFNDIDYNIKSIMNQLTNSDDLFDDVECLSRLLFDYISFFVLIGINPKQDLDDYIDIMEMTKHL